MAWPDLASEVHAAALDEFGQAVVWRPKGGAPVNVTGIFRAAHEQLQLAPDGTVATVQPTCDLRLSDLPAAPKDGDQLTGPDGVLYRISEPQPSGEGMTRFVLTRVPTS